MTLKTPSSSPRASPATGSATAARLTLVTGPPGSGKSEVVLAKIRDAATTAGARGRGAALAGDALLILPTYAAVQHTLRSALARWDARGLFDAPFVTFTSAGERFLPGFRVRSLPSAEERDRLLLAALERTDPPVYRAVAGTRGLRARLLRLLKDVKQGAAPPVEALASLRAHGTGLDEPARTRLEAFGVVAAAYQDALAAAGLEDHEDALHRLLHGLRSGAPGWTPGLLAVDGFDDLTPVEEAILDALIARTRAAGGEVIVALPDDSDRPDVFASAAGLRERLVRAGLVHRRLVGFPRAPGGTLEHLATHLFRASATRGEVPRPPADDGLVLWAALDPEDEADLVAREVRGLVEGAGASGSLVRSARDVLVVVPDLERRGPRIEAALERLGVPARCAGGRPLASEPWVRAVSGVLPLLAGEDVGLDPAAVLATLRYRALSGDAAVPIAAVDAQDMAWRVNGFPSSWEALRASAPGLAAPLDALRVCADGLAQELRGPGASGPAATLLAALEEAVPVPAPAGLDGDGRPRDPARDAEVTRALAARRRVAAIVADRVAAAERVGAAPTPREAAVDLAAALVDAAFEPPDRRLDLVHVLDPETARSWESAVVVVAGLDEEGFTRRPAEDPLLGDEDRERLAAAGAGMLPTTADHGARARRRMLALLTRARRRLVLVRAARTSEGEELPPAPLLAEVRRLVDLREGRAEPGPAPGVPALARCRTKDDLVRFAAARAGPGGASAERALVASLRAHLAPQLAARAARWRRTQADPLPAEALLRCAAATQRMSPSRLNAALACPQQHFLARVAGIRADEAPLGGPRFAASDLGRLLHAALRLALLAPGEEAEKIADRALAEATFVGVTRRAVLEEVARAVRLFRERERATAGPLKPLGLWLERRLGPDGQGVPLGEGAGRFVLEGQLDRVDAADGRVLIVDYKLGKTSPLDHVNATIAGEDLQLLLYAVAVERDTGYEVAGLEWVSATRRARAQLGSESAAGLLAPRVEDREPRLLPDDELRARVDAVERTVSDLVGRLRAGLHVLAPRDEETCDWCPVGEVCRPDRSRLRRQRREHEAAAEPTP